MATASNYPRLFTVDEANRLLSTLRPLVERVLHDVEVLRGKSETVIRDRGLAPDSPHLMHRLQEDDEIALLVGRIKGLVDEIHSYGCMCKGVEQGLIDFPCLLGGEIVFLCWKYGEEGVGHWHRVEDGYAGRRPLLDAEEKDPSGNTSYH